MKDDKKGFTLIEVLVIFGIITVITSIVLGYSGDGRERIALHVERAKLTQVISRAKFLAVSTFNDPDVPCGYGVLIDQNKYSIFRYKVDPCSSLNSGGLIAVRGDGFKVLNEFDFTLPQNMSFGDTSMDTIFFMPPDPKTLIWRDTILLESGELILQNRLDSYTIKVNSGGQITF